VFLGVIKDAVPLSIPQKGVSCLVETNERFFLVTALLQAFYVFLGKKHLGFFAADSTMQAAHTGILVRGLFQRLFLLGKKTSICGVHEAKIQQFCPSDSSKWNPSQLSVTIRNVLNQVPLAKFAAFSDTGQMHVNYNGAVFQV
jgi:hypothetical protein